MKPTLPHQWATRESIDESMSPFDHSKDNGQNGNGGKLIDRDDLQLVLGLSTTAESVHSELTYSSMSWEVNRNEDCMPIELSLGFKHHGLSEHRGYDSRSSTNLNLIPSGQSDFPNESRLKSFTNFRNQRLSFSSVDNEVVHSQLRLAGNSFSDDSDNVSGMWYNEFNIHNTPQRVNAMLDEGSTSAAKRMKRKNHDVVGLHDVVLWPIQTNGKFSLAETEESSMKKVDEPNTIKSCSSCSFVSSGELSPSSGIGVRSKKTCKFPGCGTGARGTSGLCITHGGGRRCQRPNCTKGAESRTNFCKTHGGGPRCQSLGCLKSAEGRTDFCIAHGGGHRCGYEGCTKAARGKTGKCIRHGGGKRCQREGCIKSAEGISGLCISHGGGRRCQFPDCSKGAQGSTLFCKGHGGGKRCIFEGCTKGAEGSTSLCKAHGGGKRCTFGGNTCTKSVHGGTLFCVAHGGGKRCSVPGCTKSARGRTDCCVKHGGGKRCKFDNCDKSAQGSTDFCKGHGGGKRCFWCREGSVYEAHSDGNALLDKFARSKSSGVCASHSNFMQQLIERSGCMNPPTYCNIMPISASFSGHGVSDQPSKSESSSKGSEFQLSASHSSSMQCDSEKVEYTFDAVDSLIPPSNAVDPNPIQMHQKTTLPKTFSNKKVNLPLVHKPLLQKSNRSYSTHNVVSNEMSVLFSPPSNDMSMFSFPSLERRVHGGGIMALLAKEDMQ